MWPAHKAECAAAALRILHGAAGGVAAADADARPPPPPGSHVGLCDRLGCRSGLLWQRPAVAPPPPRLSACPHCKLACYCSDVCRATAWAAGGHRELCGRLNAPPPPLRLVAPRLDGTTLASARLDGEPLAACELEGVAVEAEAGDDGPRAARARGALRALAATPLDSALRARGAQRALLVIVHPWLHALTGAGVDRPPNFSLFELMPPAAGASGGLTAQALADASCAAMRYVFAEEDRVARAPAARYEQTGVLLRVGMWLPPYMAKSMGAETDAQGRVTRLGGYPGSGAAGAFAGGLTMMLPPVARWATLGPFHCAEMCASDMSLARLALYAPRGWPPGFVAIVATFEA